MKNSIEKTIDDELTRENQVTRPVKMVLYWFQPSQVILDKEQYCYIIDNRTGSSNLVEGPIRRYLSFDERMTGGIEEKIVVPEHAYCIIKNPIVNDVIKYGEREVRVGPSKFSLHPGEKLEQAPTPEYTLTKYEALLIEALQDSGSRHAGEKYLIQGPKTFIPTKDEKVLKAIKGFALSETDGIYVQDKDTGDVRLVSGKEEETIYFLKPNEQLYEKELTHEELEGIGVVKQTGKEGVRVLTRQAANDSFLEDKWRAVVLEIEDKEVVHLYDGSCSRTEKGPKTIFLGPYERPKVLNISGGRPIKQGALKIALVRMK